MSLALTVMTAVLTSYIFLGRNLVRLANQQTLETEARRTLAFFAQDVRMASNVSGTPTAAAVSLIIPTGTVTYTYDSTTGTLTRTPSSGPALVLISNLRGLYLRYFDASGWPYDNDSAPYTTQSNYLDGIKQLSLNFSAQKGESFNGTQTPLYQFASSRLILRNRSLLP